MKEHHTFQLESDDFEEMKEALSWQHKNRQEFQLRNKSSCSNEYDHLLPTITLD